jgi:hypothetical protein
LAFTTPASSRPLAGCAKPEAARAPGLTVLEGGKGAANRDGLNNRPEAVLSIQIGSDLPTKLVHLLALKFDAATVQGSLDFRRLDKL